MRQVGEIIKPLINIPESLGECWDWQGKVNKATGYGHKQLGGKTLLAHRWVYSIFVGHIPQEMVIDHLCGNRVCVNPKHLDVVSQQTNCRRGEGAKLTVTQAKEIKQKLQSIKWGQRGKLAEEYGVSPGLISDIKYGRAWSDVTF